MISGLQNFRRSGLNRVDLLPGSLVILLGNDARALECRAGELMLSIRPTSDGRFAARAIRMTAGEGFSYESLRKKMPAFPEDQVRQIAE